MCVMEAAAYIAGEPHSDHPSCVCPVIATYARSLNDSMPEGERQKLKALIPAMIGTLNPALQSKRMFLAADRAVRAFAPAALDAAMLPEQAKALRSLPPIVDHGTARAAARAAAEARAAAGWESAIQLLQDMIEVK